VDADDQGRMRPAALAAALERGDGPAIVCAQLGNVNSGAMDPLAEIIPAAHDHGAWVHVDGAFGLWAAASPRLRPLVAGVEGADSWATDAHKMLNVPYDSGLVFCAHPEAHSRRARGFPVYAAIRALGRQGVADLVERCCELAGRFAERLAAADGVEVLNQVVFNQVLVRFLAADGDHDAHTRRVVERVQQDGTCWMSGTTWQGKAAMRISVSNWSTDEADVDRAVAAILRWATQ
jgi:glutamate/tyrosine decarboxylase-like PLP-dependent enzyme